jgi:hypothetical protein
MQEQCSMSRIFTRTTLSCANSHKLQIIKVDLAAHIINGGQQTCLKYSEAE